MSETKEVPAMPGTIIQLKPMPDDPYFEVEISGFHRNIGDDRAVVHFRIGNMGFLWDADDAERIGQLLQVAARNAVEEREAWNR